MTLDTEARFLLDLMDAAAKGGRPKLETLPHAVGRAAVDKMSEDGEADPPEVAEVAHGGFAGPGDQDIGFRRYRPLGVTEAVLPTLIYYHGGGFVIGNLDTHDSTCRRLANRSRCQVIAIDYRLSPEHPFPAPIDAGVAALDAARAQMQAFRDALATSTGGHPTEEQFRAAAQRLGAGPEHRVEDLEPVDREGRTPSAGTYVPAFATAVWAMDPAQPLSQPFATSFGVHVALLLEEVPPMTRTDDEARDILRDEYAVAARVNAARELVTRLHQRSRVEISESTLREAERLARRGGP